MLVILVVAIVAILLLAPRASTPTATAPTQQASKDASTPQNTPEPYAGTKTTVAGQFTVTVPNGWSASISEIPSFTAIMFGRPEHLGDLVYQADTEPQVNRDGITAWSGLTEHFFIRMPQNQSQAFDPTEHLEISSEPFTFDDGTVGQKYYVVKHADEAKKWGGLLRDNEWQGRTYIYEKDGKRVEAHLALYPSSSFDIPSAESVARSVTLSQ